jgi:hypothetical protein
MKSWVKMPDIQIYEGPLAKAILTNPILYRLAAVLQDHMEPPLQEAQIRSAVRAQLEAAFADTSYEEQLVQLEMARHRLERQKQARVIASQSRKLMRSGQLIAATVDNKPAAMGAYTVISTPEDSLYTLCHLAALPEHDEKKLFSRVIDRLLLLVQKRDSQGDIAVVTNQKTVSAYVQRRNFVPIGLCDYWRKTGWTLDEVEDWQDTIDNLHQKGWKAYLKHQKSFLGSFDSNI